MGEIPNFLPEEDQQSNEEHPLRILSQENLTVVSTFTGKGGTLALNNL
jgi:kinesin family protein 26